VYCGSSDAVHQDYFDGARTLGRALAARGITLVFGAGKTGLMGALAEAVLEAGGQAIGVIPQIFNTPTLVHGGLSELRVVDDMHIRKATMAELAQAFIALPGGFGTLEELLEILTWAQIGLHNRPVGVLNIRSYFDPLLELIQHLRREGFIYDQHRALLLADEHPEALLEQLENYKPPTGTNRWLNREEAE
jgi:hypothetical protein